MLQDKSEVCPVIEFKKVDFPIPLSPTKAYTFPASKVKLGIKSKGLEYPISISSNRIILIYALK